jgi:hypothetical protein
MPRRSRAAIVPVLFLPEPRHRPTSRQAGAIEARAVDVQGAGQPERRERLDMSMVDSVAGLIENGTLTDSRPFRPPHHPVSLAGLVGGGLQPQVLDDVVRPDTSGLKRLRDAAEAMTLTACGFIVPRPCPIAAG